MDRRSFLVGLGVVAGVPLTANAQRSEKVYRVGFLRRSSPIPSELAALREGLRELGYIEGQNLVIAERYAHGESQHLSTLAAELVSLGEDVIVVDGPLTIRAAQTATKTIPIVFTIGSADPVRLGLVASFAHPGGNVTGLTTGGGQLGGKRLELLKDALSHVGHVAILLNPENPSNPVKSTQEAAHALAIKLQMVEARGSADWPKAFEAIKRGRAQGVIVFGDATFSGQRHRLVELVARSRLPSMFTEREFVDAGGLMSYAASITANFRRAATYIDKILKGAKPADLPVEEPTKFDLVINLKTAKALRLTIPPSVLVRADEVIQ